MKTNSRAISAGKTHTPKTVSLAGLVGADRRVRDAYRESGNETLKEVEKYLQVRRGQKFNPGITTQKNRERGRN